MFPALDAVMFTEPADTILTIFPEIIFAMEVSELVNTIKLFAFTADVVAVNAKSASTVVLVANAPNVIVWLALFTVSNCDNTGAGL